LGLSIALKSSGQAHCLPRWPSDSRSHPNARVARHRHSRTGVGRTGPADV